MAPRLGVLFPPQNLRFGAVFDHTARPRVGALATLVFCLPGGYVNAAVNRRAQSRKSSCPTKAELICT